MKRLMLQLVSAVLALLTPAGAVYINFETLPDGSTPAEGTEIDDQYWDTHGVSFELVHRITGGHLGHPIIAQAGMPMIAFILCGANTYADTALPGQNLGERFLAYPLALSYSSSTVLLIRYAEPVTQASGVLIDVDVWDAAVAEYEVWDIIARDPCDNEIDMVVIDSRALPEPDWFCPPGSLARGDGYGARWSFDVSGTDQQIASILFKFTGVASRVRIAFDNFSPTSAAPPAEIELSSEPWRRVCSGDSTTLTAQIIGGSGPFAYRWQQEQDEIWVDLGDSETQEVAPLVETRYRLLLTDDDARLFVSEPYTVYVCPPDPDFNRDGCVDLADLSFLAGHWLDCP